MGDFNTNLGRKAQVSCRFKQILGFMHSISIAYANYLKKESEMKTKKNQTLFLQLLYRMIFFLLKLKQKHLYTVRLVINLEEAQESV